MSNSHIQEIIQIELADLYTNAQQLKNEGWRLAQICATTLEETYELSYSFARDYDLRNLRLYIPFDQEIESITPLFEPAFLYENELHDLFGVKVLNIKVDYNGQLYKISTPTPYAKKSEEEDKGNE